MQSISKLLKEKTPPKETKVEYEFQEIGLELQKYFGMKNVFFVFYKPWGKVSNVRHALKVCKEKNIKAFPYFVGILKKL